MTIPCPPRGDPHQVVVVAHPPLKMVARKGLLGTTWQDPSLMCRVEELALPTRAIQLSGEVLSTDEAASVELCEAEAAH